MKSFLIIGMGSLGNHLCEELSKNSCEIMIADINPLKVENTSSSVVTARVCDCTNRSVLESLGVEDFDVCFVCIENLLFVVKLLTRFVIITRSDKYISFFTKVFSRLVDIFIRINNILWSRFCLIFVV